jgi:hypothetical protein
MKVAFCATLLILCMFAAQAQEASGWWNQPKDINGNAGLMLSDQQITVYSQKALSGDSDAANHLASFYLIVGGSRSKAEYWYRIAAENGDVAAQRSYGEMLLEDSKDKTRAVFWLERAAKAGDSLATEILQKMQ